jgi:hypothetical protein
MGRSVLAVIAGYILMVVLVMAAGMFVMANFPADFTGADGKPRLPGLGWYAVNLAYSFVFALAGGHTCARLARRAEMAHAGALAAFLGVMGLISIAAYSGETPAPWWWTAGEVAVGVLGALAGGLIRAQARAAEPGQVSSAARPRSRG